VLESVAGVKAALTTVGFVLSPDRLVTLRFARVAAFDEVAASYSSVAEPSARDAFLKILEKVVDHAADALEHANAELASISHSAFHAERPRGYSLAKASEALRASLRKLGRMGDRISHIRDTLLGIGRIAAFADETWQESHLAAASARFNAIRADIISLNDYQTHLSGKVQFLLDATLGFISIQQNDIVKTLTIVSVVGVPPVLVAGIYGMNFKFMPELSWALGYPFGLVLIVVSTLFPVAWFKWRGWM
jgi:magnesium transporter